MERVTGPLAGLLFFFRPGGQLRPRPPVFRANAACLRLAVFPWAGPPAAQPGPLAPPPPRLLRGSPRANLHPKLAPLIFA
ncbi:hypothetical protein METBIDRAFT_31541 [Metschnikowia bicuspidata var. bicuspidata NRRL YB-4993]|uniref:Uncharacterized protein n=1 Tax=Metschnikowia bicuspidata var. bicuspidata NRRL YB-4993 TaxID=869754 RepID=A0A1A0H9R9_9ASCO|nr:hypothetical protein METBIDRAFT_31541 [Metschnikowia bicuspidata var. bicuspidata NRRL YB-4993]OBA20874.1 hypothetical protein METBIDRAFT_31541 [Metschnikowia bicuspidata var. bicuspidata NRRL YB-4993]